ncbi:MAG: ATP synthase F1 subunit delta [Bacteroidales bacterium]|nr:ATP synthase F1 subunit delta [Bacteroidales bacterium]
MKSGKIAHRYAKAFFDFSVEKNLLERSRADMNLLAQVIGENKDLQRLLGSPVVGNRKKESIMREVFGAHLDKICMEFILLLTRNRREMFLADIAASFESLYRELKGIHTVKLVTAAPVNDAIRKEIIRKVTEGYHGSVELEESVDPDLVGGFVLQFEDRKYDASLKRELDRMKKEFGVNLYIREF